MTTTPSLPDPDGTAQRVALEIIALDPERRAMAVMAATDHFAALAEADGCSPVDAAEFALEMQWRIGEVMRAIEISGGGAGGRA